MSDDEYFPSVASPSSVSTTSFHTAYSTTTVHSSSSLYGSGSSKRSIGITKGRFDERGHKVACAKCIDGHRTSECTHFDRVQYRIAPRGRPRKTCDLCGMSTRKKARLDEKCRCPADITALEFNHDPSSVRRQWLEKSGRILNLPSGSPSTKASTECAFEEDNWLSQAFPTPYQTTDASLMSMPLDSLYDPSPKSNASIEMLDEEMIAANNAWIDEQLLHVSEEQWQQWQLGLFPSEEQLLTPRADDNFNWSWSWCLEYSNLVQDSA